MEKPSARRPLLGKDARPQPRTRRRWLVVAAVVVAAVLATATRWATPQETVAEATAEPMDRHFATKTAYWDQRRQTTGSLAAAAAAPEKARGLRLVQTQLVTRHGIRYPTLSPIRDTEALLQKLAPFEASLPRWLRGYALPYNASVEGALADAGVREMESLARRQLADHGRHATRATYTRDAFQLSHTHVQRTKDSAVAFARRYFENPQDIHYIERPKHNDTLLRFFDVCDRYQQEVKRNNSALDQMHAFAKSQAMATSLRSLTRALHVDATTLTLTTKDLAAAFSACAFDVALYDIHDQWCSLLTQDMVATLDFDDDLKAFYQLAGGYAINYEMAAVLLQDIVAVMDQRIAGQSAVEGAFRFAHAETTLPLMTLLGFGAKTPPLTAMATREQIETRGFRTSALAPFGANIEFRLYERTDERGAEHYFVQVLVNERDDVVLRGCGSVFCPLNTLKTSVWHEFLYDFDFAQQCRL